MSNNPLQDLFAENKYQYGFVNTLHILTPLNYLSQFQLFPLVLYFLKQMNIYITPNAQ